MSVGLTTNQQDFTKSLAGFSFLQLGASQGRSKATEELYENQSPTERLQAGAGSSKASSSGGCMSGRREVRPRSGGGSDAGPQGEVRVAQLGMITGHPEDVSWLLCWHIGHHSQTQDLGKRGSLGWAEVKGHQATQSAGDGLDKTLPSLSAVQAPLGLGNPGSEQSVS